MSTSVRVPDDLLSEIETHRDRLGVQWGQEVTRSRAVRDLIGRGLAQASPNQPQGQAAASLRDLALHFVPMVPMGDPAWMSGSPWSAIHLSSEQPSLRLRSYDYSGSGCGRLVDIAYEWISGDPELPKIDELRFAGGSDLLPYEGRHPLHSWAGSSPSSSGRPMLRDRPLVRAANVVEARVLVEGDAPRVLFRLFAVLVCPSNHGLDQSLRGAEQRFRVCPDAWLRSLA